MDDGIGLGDLLAASGAQGANGWARLGGVLGGAADGTKYKNAYAQELKTRATVDDLMAQARQRQLEAISRSGAADALRQLGVQNPEALGTLLNTGLDLHNVTGGLDDLANQSAQGEALDAARSGNVDLENRLVSVLGKKPLERTQVQDNTLIDPYAAPDAQAAQGGDAATPLGDAMIGAEHALVGQRGAAAGADNALTAQRRTLLPLQAQNIQSEIDNRRVGKTGKVTLPQAASMKEVFGDPDTGMIDQDKAQAFMRWKATKASSDPRFNDGEYALEQWVANGPLDGEPLPLGADGKPDPAAADYTMATGGLGDAAAAPAVGNAAPTASSPYKEGARLKGPGGKLFVVKNGVPVPVQ